MKTSPTLWIRPHGDVARHLRKRGRTLPPQALQRESAVELGFTKAIAAAVLLALLAAALAGVFSSCTGLPVKQPAQAWVEAERATHDSLSKRLRLYLAADEVRELAGEVPVLPMLEREITEGLLKDWDFMIRSHEQTLPVPAQ